MYRMQKKRNFQKEIKIILGMDKVELSLDMFETYLGEKLSRNLGISPDDLDSIAIDNVSDKLVILEVKLLEEVIQIPGFLNDGENDIIEQLLDEETFIELMDLAKSNKRVDFFWHQEKFPDNFKIIKLPMDVTNTHAILRSGMKKYHLKIFVRINKTEKELAITQQLAKLDLYPLVRGYVKIDGKPIVIIWDQLENGRNYDDYLGSMYSGVIKGFSSMTQFEEASFYSYKTVVDTLRKFWETLNPAALDLQLTEDEARELWIQKLKKDLETIELGRDNIDAILGLQDELTVWLKETNFFVIHGDCWLRQFIRSQEATYLLDLEDVTLGPIGYDIGGLYNSILQQGKYFQDAYPERNDISKDMVKLCWNIIKEQKKFITVDTFDIDWEREIQLGMKLRAIHELAYLLNHQPELRWLIDFIITEIIE